MCIPTHSFGSIVVLDWSRLSVIFTVLNTSPVREILFLYRALFFERENSQKDFFPVKCEVSRKEKNMIAEPSEVTFSRRIEEERREHLPVCESPVVFLDFLRGTWEYRDLLNHRVTETQERMNSAGIDDEITSVEIIPLFEDGELFKRLFWDYYQDVIHLTWNPDSNSWPEKFCQRFKTYEEMVAKVKLACLNSDPDAIKKADADRKNLHDFTAKALVEERIVPNLSIGRVIARMLLVDRGKEELKIARQVDISRIITELPDSKLKKQIFRGIEKNWQGESLFTLERAAKLQDLFIETVDESAKYVERKTFIEAK